MTEQPRLITALQDPQRYPHPADKVELIETHISWVLLAGDCAYKIKKSLDLGFLDYSTLDRRRACCEEELRLNRRTAPQLLMSCPSAAVRMHRASACSPPSNMR
jgi:aminoglycoside phosphotransferase family enzyme